VQGLLVILVSIANGGNVTVRFFNIAEFGKATELIMGCLKLNAKWLLVRCTSLAPNDMQLTVVNYLKK
jgi:hypothetical protein